MAHHLSHSPSRKRHARAHSSPTTLLTTLLVLSFLTTRTTAVPLSAFMPSLDPATLTPSCAAIYTSPIPTCTAADFSANSQCSSPCITSLVTLSTSIYNACGGDTRNDQLLVGQFLAGNGIPILCKGVVVVTMSGAESMTSVLPSATAGTSSYLTRDWKMTDLWHSFFDHNTSIAIAELAIYTGAHIDLDTYTNTIGNLIAVTLSKIPRHSTHQP